MVTPTDRQPTIGADIVRAIGQGIAALAAAIGAIYVIGGLVLWLRLWLVGKPQLAVVSGLPRESVISIGLVVVLLAATVGGLHIFRRLILRPHHEAPPKATRDRWPSWLKQRWPDARWLSVALLLPPTTVFLAAYLTKEGWIHDLNPGRLATVPFFLVVAVGLAFVYIRTRELIGEAYWQRARHITQDHARKAKRVRDETRLRARLARSHARSAATAATEAERELIDARRHSKQWGGLRGRYTVAMKAREAERLRDEASRCAREAANLSNELKHRTHGARQAYRAAEEDGRAVTALAKRGYNSLPAVGLNALVLAAAFLPAFLAAGVLLPLPDGRVCLPGGSYIDGHYLGETENRVYLADGLGERILSFPKENITRVHTGSDAHVTTNEYLFDNRLKVVRLTKSRASCPGGADRREE